MADRHVGHDEHEADPGHVGAGLEVLGDAVGTAGAYEESTDAIP